jgi:hypothetical protein
VGRQTIIASNGAQKLDDYYEVLQISRNAHPLIIAKVYRLLAVFYHPDNRDTGNKDAFLRVVEAYRVLSDPVRRRTYDCRTFGNTSARIDELHDRPSTIRVSPTRVAENEGELRQIILHVLYTTRRNRPQNPGLSLMTLAELVGCSIDVMQFTLWYLRGKKLIEIVDDGNVAITVLGVDHIESNQARYGGSHGMLAMEAHPAEIDLLSDTTNH